LLKKKRKDSAMQFASLLSQHSSNPLEIASSDPRSRAYLREAKRARLSSEDEGLGNLHHGQQDPELNAYHRQVASMFPKFTAVQPGAMVDLDDDEDMGFGQANTVVGDEEGGDTQEADNPDEDEEVPIGDEDFSEGALSLALRPPEEKVEIEHEMLELENSVPSLRNDYRLLDRLGTGTFSSVYKAIDLGALDRWDDTVARQRDGKGVPVAPVPSSTGRVYVAIKRIYVTSSPERIRNEIAIMELCRACRHVAQLITAFRHKDQVVVVMPYQPNTDFRVCVAQAPFCQV
jgi:cell division control protein 7